MTRRAAGALLAAVALAGCASPAVTELPLAASGRMSVRVEASGERPAQSLTASFEWRGDGERGELTLLTPFGTQLALARWQPGSVRLTTNEGETRFDTLEALAEKAFGERVPLQAWPDWLAGRPWPGAAFTAVPARAGIGSAGFEQLGWSVDLTQRTQGRIEARRRAAPVVTVRIVRDDAAAGAP